MVRPVTAGQGEVSQVWRCWACLGMAQSGWVRNGIAGVAELGVVWSGVARNRRRRMIRRGWEAFGQVACGKASQARCGEAR